MMASDFLDEVARAFATLTQRGLLGIVSSNYDGQAFGNATVVLVGGAFRIRLVRDRSQVIAEVACGDRPEDWSSLQRVLRVMLGPAAPPEGIVTSDEAAAMVARYYDEIQNACSPPNVVATRAKLAELERQAVEAFVERARRGSS